MTTATMTPRRCDPVAKLARPYLDTAAKLLDHLGVPGERIHVIPEVGSATIDDVVACERESGILCELVDGILVEKGMGYYESRVAAVLIGMLCRFLEDHGDPGFLLGADGMIWVAPDQMRMPDVCYFSWDRFPGRLLPAGAVLDLVPDWAIEVLSPSNTQFEMARKRREYFDGGAKLVWQVDPIGRSVDVYTAIDAFTTYAEDAVLTGAPVLLGFSVSIRQWFERAGQRSE